MNIGDMDQAFTAIIDMARIVKKHYDEMVKAGFSRDEALKLSIEFQRNIINPK